ncbi:DegV family protein [Fontimonas sp. SYSU GA230001]|uniref:DegV family protein n=1 Tax=Fontimonas sp. SYSU GA230001 TaxID=3142450 RepID=UPI0032B5FC73
MRIGLVVDSACDLPRDYIEQHRIGILPITIHLEGRDFVDRREPEATLDFYRNHMSAAADAGTSAFSPEQIKEFFLNDLVTQYDFVVCLTIASSRSPIYENAVKASFAILSEYKPVRSAAGVAGPFSLRVIDSQNLFAGQAITAVETVRMIQDGVGNPNKIRERLDQLIQNTYGYMIPRDLNHLRKRAQKRGDRSIGLVGAMLGTALDIKPLLRAYRNETGPVAKLRHFDDAAQKAFGYIEKRVTAGLMTPTVSLCYGGDLADMRKLPGYDELIRTCRRKNVEVFESIMSITGGANVGEGALAFAFAAEPHEVEL